MHPSLRTRRVKGARAPNSPPPRTPLNVIFIGIQVERRGYKGKEMDMQGKRRIQRVGRGGGDGYRGNNEEHMGIHITLDD